MYLNNHQNTVNPPQAQQSTHIMLVKSSIYLHPHRERPHQQPQQIVEAQNRTKPAPQSLRNRIKPTVNYQRVLAVVPHQLPAYHNRRQPISIIGYTINRMVAASTVPFELPEMIRNIQINLLRLLVVN